MNLKKKTPDNLLLIYSIVFAIIFSLGALIIGFLASSQVILFDGIFSLSSVILTYISILSVKFIEKEDLKNYPFGKEAFEPFIVLGQYSIILVVSVTNIINAIQVILEGGRDVHIEFGIFYGVFSSTFCFGVMLYLKYRAEQNITAIEKIEIEQWKFSFLFSLAMLVGFCIAWMLTKTSFETYVIFIDPILNILITLAFIRTAIIAIHNCMKELLQAAPSPELTSIITKKVDSISSEYIFSDMVLRLGKVGGELIIEIDYVIEENSEMDSIRMQDLFRDKLAGSLAEVPYKKWLNVNFIGDIKWAE